MPALLKLTGLGSGVMDLVFTSAPLGNPIYDPAVDVAVGLTADDSLYTQKFGNGSANIVISFPKESPLKWEDYIGGYDPIARTQTANRQSLCNIFENIAVGALNSITAVIGDGYGNSISVTANIMNSPNLGFKALDNGNYIGDLKLRIQR